MIGLRIAIYNTYDRNPWLSSGIYLAGISLRLFLFPISREQWIVIATLPYAYCFEGLMVTFGLYEYYHPVFLGIPGWLFIWWIFLVPIFVKECSDRMEYWIKNGTRYKV